MTQLQPHQQRVVEERAELEAKIAKLKAFIDTDTFNALGIDERILLRDQLYTMRQYSQILWMRLDLWGVSKGTT